MKRESKRLRWKYILHPGVDPHSYRIYEDGSIYSTVSRMWIKPWEDKKGYLEMSVWIDGAKKGLRLNRILATAFIPKTRADIKRDRDIVHFVDYDNTNYSLDNLKWVNPLELHILNDIRENDIKKTPSACADYIVRLFKAGYDAEEIIYAIGLKNTAPTLRSVNKILKSLA